MKRILLRAKKSPFEVVSPEDTLRRTVIGTNTGDLIWMTAAYKLLSTKDTELEIHRFRPDPADAGLINERYDAYVVPLSDAFRPAFESYLVALTSLIERLRIPVVVLGVGTRSTLDYDLGRLKPIEPSVRAFVRAVLDRSASIGVRGEFTATYLRQLGFREVEVIGCPSMFMYGDSLRVEKRVPRLEPKTPIAIHVSPELEVMRDVLELHHSRYQNLAYIAQDAETLAMSLWGVRLGTASSDRVSLGADHPLVRANRVRTFVDALPWISYLREFQFVFGSRIHGSIAGLLSGTPAHVIAHDSRTLELARYFDIPHRTIDEVRSTTDAAELFDEADFTKLNAGQAERFARFTGYMQRNGLHHIYEEGEDPKAFDVRLAAVPYPAVVEVRHRRVPSPHGLMHVARHRLRRHTPNWVRRLRAAGERARVLAGR